MESLFNAFGNVEDAILEVSQANHMICTELGCTSSMTCTISCCLG